MVGDFQQYVADPQTAGGPCRAAIRHLINPGIFNVIWSEALSVGQQALQVGADDRQAIDRAFDKRRPDLTAMMANSHPAVAKMRERVSYFAIIVALVAINNLLQSGGGRMSDEEETTRIGSVQCLGAKYHKVLISLLKFGR